MIGEELIDLIENQKRRSGVLSGFSVEAILINTKIRITADDDSGFTRIYFNLNEDIESLEGSVLELADQDVDIPVDATIKRYYISVDVAGTIYTTETKTLSTSLTRVHLVSYTAKNGITANPGLIANPFLTHSDKTFQGILDADGGRIDDLVITSPDNATLGLLSSAYRLIANAINYVNNKVSPHVRFADAENPMEWTYYYRGLELFPLPGTTALLDPTQWDNNGSLDPMPAGPNNSTVQLVAITPIAQFVILYGQEVFATFDDAVLNARNIEFDLPSSIFESAEVARIVMKRSATDSADGDEVIIINTSAGAGGGSGVPPDTNIFFDADFTLKNSTDATKLAQFEASKQATSTNKIHKLPEDNSELATLDLKETVSGTKRFPDPLFIIVNDADDTKEAEFNTSNIPTSTINTYDFPANDGELVVDLPSHSVTELSDVNDAGSGDIITDAERTQISQNESDILLREEFTGGGQQNLGAAGTNKIIALTNWYRVSSTVDGITAIINSNFIINTQEGSENQSTRFVICMQNRDLNWQPSFTLLSNHSFNSSIAVIAVRLIADQDSGTNGAYHVEVQIQNDLGSGDAYVKIHDRSFKDNQSVVNFILQSDTPTSPARIVKEWSVGSLVFNVSEAFTVDNNDNIGYGFPQNTIRKITAGTNLPFALCAYHGGFGSGDQFTRNGVFDPASVGSSVSESDLNNYGLVSWINTAGDDGSRKCWNRSINGDTLIDRDQSGQNQFAFKLVKDGWYECTLKVSLEGRRSNTNFSARILVMNSSNVITEALGIFQLQNEQKIEGFLKWSGFYSDGDQFICMKTSGNISDLRSSSHRFEIKCNCEVTP